MRDIGTLLNEIFGVVQGAAAKTKIYRRINPDHVIGEEPPVDHPDEETYFQLTLSEMFLVDRREYWRSFLPMVLVLAEFVFENKQRSVPVFAGSELLKAIENVVKDEPV